MQATQRLYLTQDKKMLVGAADKRRAFLYAVPGDEIPTSAAERFGLVDGGLKGSSKGSKKELTPDNDPPDLTAIKGIGKATAKHLAAGGIDGPAKLATVDPANPPKIEGIPEAAPWAAWVEGAKALVPNPSIETK